jgi:glycosyltransferase involved in cell wall biosynthesis
MENYVYHLVQGLPRRRIKVSCLAPYESAVTESFRNIGCSVYVTSMPDEPVTRSIQYLCELIQHEKIDLLHAHLPRAHILAGLAGRLTNTPTVATVHGMEVNTHELGIARLVGSHLALVCQQAYAQALSIGIPAERVSMIPNGVNLQVFHPAAQKIDFRVRYKIPKRAPLIGYVGRFNWEKGPDLFIRAAHHILEHRPDVHFIMVGDGPMRSEIDKTIAEMGIEKRIHRPGLLLENSKLFPAFDLLIQTSRVEGMPFVLLEAMACGIPTAVINVGGVGELAVAGVTSTLSANEDWRGLGDAVLQLLDNPEVLKEMGANARKRVEMHFNLEDRLDQFASLFTVLARQGSERGSEPAPWLWSQALTPSDWRRPERLPAKVAGANVAGAKAAKPGQK